MLPLPCLPNIVSPAGDAQAKARGGRAWQVTGHGPGHQGVESGHQGGRTPRQTAAVPSPSPLDINTDNV